jgi:predicted Zn-dependent protease with MMP-like domain
MYPYEPYQDIMLDIKVVPVGDIELLLDDMNLEVNADYFNRYGIGINLILQERDLDYSDGLPDGQEGDIMLYVVPMEYMYKEGVAGYAVTRVFGYGSFGKIVLGEDFQTNGTLAHEIGHIMGLRHVCEDDNIMKLGHRSTQYDIPDNFNKQQIDTIISNLHWYVH